MKVKIHISTFDGDELVAHCAPHAQEFSGIWAIVDGADALNAVCWCAQPSQMIAVLEGVSK